MKQYRALYRENRPEVFDEILGQEQIVRILRHQIATDTVSHAYLFCGTRGTGKTTTARILAKAVNCTGEGERPCGECPSCRAIAEGNFIDVIEIDAASNNGVENIRELRESVNYPPSAGRRKVYIIDEVHMLSTGAFNALLKTLEEPPAHVMFILATTNPEKLPQTVLSRCMRLDFRRVSAAEIKANMARICQEHGVEITEGALALLARNADGSVRDSLSILEQCMSSGEARLDRDKILEFLGTVSEEFYIELTEKVLTRNISQALLLLEGAMEEGKDVRQMMKDWMAHYRALLIAKFVKNPGDMLNMSSENIELLKEQSAKIELAELNSSIVTLAKTINDARYSTQARILMEVAIVTIAGGLEYGARPAAPANRPATPTSRPATPTASTKPAAEQKPAPATTEGGIPAIQIEEPEFDSAAMEEAMATMRADAVPKQSPYAGTDRDGAPSRQVNSVAAPTPAVPVSAPSEPEKKAPMTAPNAAAAEETEEVPEAFYSQEELDQLWNDIFEQAEPLAATTNSMRRAMLAAVGERQFKVIAPSKMAKGVLMMDEDLISDLMSRQLGREMHMVIKVQGDGPSGGKPDATEIARQASAVLGTEVKIRD
ncbi:DNA polymerase III subunit gamma/tau [Eubacterium sp. AB3007]|uniref:DNA polymerase III subunit gamma/tau n=1 Tax=Eubacterium sp. AB3007 TaxID=1392487 RepID=UPI000691F852|nr:DNA polymerase III subunit gamma/tau [Eubacterium sp. AB3007]